MANTDPALYSQRTWNLIKQIQTATDQIGDRVGTGANETTATLISYRQMCFLGEISISLSVIADLVNSDWSTKG